MRATFLMFPPGVAKGWGARINDKFEINVKHLLGDQLDAPVDHSVRES